MAEAAREIDARLASPLRLMLSWPGVLILLESLRGARHLPQLCAVAEGEKDGRRARVGAGLTAEPPGGMGGITGVPAALGLGMVARGRVRRPGVFAPDQVVDPDAFFRELAPHCVGLPEGQSPVRIDRAAA